MFKLPLRHDRKFSGQFALIDNKDVRKVLGFAWTWHLHSNGYAAAWKGKEMAYLHNVILDPGKGNRVDHEDGDKLNCQRYNLRPATNTQNQRNRKKNVRKCASKYKGVSTVPESGNWRAYIKVDGRQINLGCYATEHEAAYAYNVASRQYFGKFAKLNRVVEVELRPISNREAGGTGYLGVKRKGNRYIARAKRNGVEVHIGSYPTAKAASRARTLYLLG